MAAFFGSAGVAAAFGRHPRRTVPFGDIWWRAKLATFEGKTAV
jgi:hypothetical protein